MSTAVDGQGAALNEGLVARFVVAGIGAFVGMYSIMALEIRLSIETLRDTIAISIELCVGTSTSTTEVELSAQDRLPSGNLHANRTEKGEQPCR